MEILYEDELLLVVNKPAGWAVLSEVGGIEQTVTRYLEEHNLGGLVPAHRLDNTTSGILVIAKDQPTHDFLRDIWNTGQVIKEYTALVLGTINQSLTIETPIAHHPSHKNRMMPCETAEIAAKLSAQPAFTQVERLTIRTDSKKSLYSFVKVVIRTGVRHQIRVHLASVGHPLAGDHLYQNAKRFKQDRTDLKRPFLHASRMSLPHPKTGKKIEVVCELPMELQRVWARLK